MIADIAPTVRILSRLCSVRRSTAGFMLLEVMIAVGVFAFAVVGLSMALNRILDIEILSGRDQRIRLELESRLAETRAEPLTPGKESLGKDAMGVEYMRIVEELELKNMDDVRLNGMYLLRLEAKTPNPDDNPPTVEIYVYQR